MPKDLIQFRTNFDDSVIFVKTDSTKAANLALKSIRKCRIELEKYILKHPEFLKALKPIEVPPSSPEVVQRMASAANLSGVGPMAAVAGAISDIAVDRMIREGAQVAVLENGGEISANSTKELNIAIISSSPSISGKFGLKISPKEMPLGIGTSSAILGHGISFGDADAVTIVAKNAALADAVATCTCNKVQSRNIEATIENGLEKIKKINGVRGGIIIHGEYIGVVGKIPQIISIESLEEAPILN